MALSDFMSECSIETIKVLTVLGSVPVMDLINVVYLVI